MKTSRSRIEMETTITFNAEQEHALVGTCHDSMKNRLKKLTGVEIHRTDGEWTTYRIPKKWIKIHAPRKLSEATKQALSDRMKGRSLSRNPSCTRENSTSETKTVER